MSKAVGDSTGTASAGGAGEGGGCLCCRRGRWRRSTTRTVRGTVPPPMRTAGRGTTVLATRPRLPSRVSCGTLHSTACRDACR